MIRPPGLLTGSKRGSLPKHVASSFVLESTAHGGQPALNTGGTNRYEVRFLCSPPNQFDKLLLRMLSLLSCHAERKSYNASTSGNGAQRGDGTGLIRMGRARCVDRGRSCRSITRVLRTG